MDRFQLKHATICHFCRSRNLELERSKFRGDHESSGYGAAVFLSESGTTAFEALKDLLLEIAQERELGTLLPLIVRRVAESSELGLWCGGVPIGIGDHGLRGAQRPPARDRAGARARDPLAAHRAPRRREL